MMSQTKRPELTEYVFNNIDNKTFYKIQGGCKKLGMWRVGELEKSDSTTDDSAGNETGYCKIFDVIRDYMNAESRICDPLNCPLYREIKGEIKDKQQKD